MKNFEINLKNVYPRLPADVRLTMYILDNPDEYATDFHRPMVVVYPGGGYAMTSHREAEPIAMAFAAQGYDTAILWYNCHAQGIKHPQPLLEGCAAVAYCRDHAVEWGADPAQLYICGFSAGGHLAASVGTLWKLPVVSETLGVESRHARPDGMILCYPVITSDPSFAHNGSIQNLLADSYGDPALMEQVSLEKQVAEDTPRTFLWSTFDDGCVPVKNTLVMANALREKNVPFELHIFPYGRHGLSLATKQVYKKGTAIESHHPCTEWITLASRFIGENF